MENQPMPISPDISPTNPEVAQPSIPPQTKTNLVMPVVLILLISGAVFGLSGYYLGKQSAVVPKQSIDSTYITPSPAVSVIPTPTNNRKAYANSEKGISLEYPDGWVVEKSDNPGVFAKLIKRLPANSVNETYCKPGITDGGTDCYPEVWIELSSTSKPSDYRSVTESKPSSAFGESMLAGKTEFMQVNGITARLEYLREDSYHPSFSFIDLSNEILRLKAYAPTSKNCVGTCPEYDDSQLVRDSAAEIKVIISSFKGLAGE